MTVAVGIDGSAAGWFAVVLADARPPAGLAAASLEEIAAAVPEAEGFGIDMPIGLPIDGHRAADVEARRFLGPRRASIFFTPVRPAVEAPTHEQANAASVRLTGKGVSRQAWALRRKILEVETFAREASVPVWEVHPEVSFTALTGRPPQASKKTWTGLRERQRALEGAGISVDGFDAAGARTAADDVLDAAAAAWSTLRLLRGSGRSLPAVPPRDPESGRPVAIWY